MKSLLTTAFYLLAQLAASASAEAGDEPPSIWLASGFGSNDAKWTERYDLKAQSSINNGCLPKSDQALNGFETSLDPSDKPMSGCLYSFANDDCKGDYTGFKLDFENLRPIQGYLKRTLDKDEVLPKSFRVSDVHITTMCCVSSTDYQKACVMDDKAQWGKIAGPVRTAGATIGASVIAKEDAPLTRPS